MSWAYDDSEAEAPAGDGPAGSIGVVGTVAVEGARCVGRTALFFPTYNERPSTRARREQRARQLCGRCPVQDACRSFARRHGEYGLWGGETDEERVLAGVRLRYPYSPKTIKRERQRLAVRCADVDEPGPDDLAATEAWLQELELAS